MTSLFMTRLDSDYLDIFATEIHYNKYLKNKFISSFIINFIVTV